MLEKINALIYPLPEDIRKCKDMGDFEREEELIQLYSENPHTPAFLKERLEVEKEILRRLPEQYPYDEEEALKIIQEEIPDFTMEELHHYEDIGGADWIYVNGIRHLQDRFYASMKKVYAEIAERAHEVFSANNRLDQNMNKMKAEGKVSYHIRLKTSIQIKEEYFHPGEVLVHLPIPASCQNMSNIHILSYSENGMIDKEDSLSRTISFHEAMKENHPFEVEYEYDSSAVYQDLLNGPEGEECDIQECLEEQLPQIVFTPSIKALCNELKGNEKDPVQIAYAFYKYCTENVTYSFMRSYLTIENIPEYALLQRIGDCGVKALLFIVLCRCAGIPAKWQSGLYVNGEDVGNHDWAMFYVRPFGWVFADPSFGGSAYRAGNIERQKFYFGNLDPFRMAANNAFQQELSPAKTMWRNDPYDNQSGEMEYVNEVGLLANQFETNKIIVDFKENA